MARSHSLAVHIDGARMMNASVAADVAPADYARLADSCWIDLSKGLGCPMGGVLAGSTDFIDAVWWWKQRLGGALRQAGIVAAAGLYALEQNVDRLADDHANAQAFAARVEGAGGLTVMHTPIETNLVFMDVSATGHNAGDLSAALERDGINIGAMSEYTLRAVTHLDADASDVAEAAEALVGLLEG